MESVEELCDHITLLNKSKNILSGEINKIKNQYKSGIYELTFEGDYDKFQSALNSDSNIIEKKKNQDNNYTVRIKANKKLGQNELLSSIISVIHINSYFEVIPSMNDVFIKVIESQN